MLEAKAQQQLITNYIEGEYSCLRIILTLLDMELFEMADVLCLLN